MEKVVEMVKEVQMVIEKNAMVYQKLRPSTGKSSWHTACVWSRAKASLRSLTEIMEWGKRQQLQLLPVISPPQINIANAFVVHNKSLSGEPIIPLNFSPTFYYGNLQHTETLKKLYSEYSHIHYLDSIIWIFPIFIIRYINTPKYFLVHFKEVGSISIPHP